MLEITTEFYQNIVLIPKLITKLILLQICDLIYYWTAIIERNILTVK